MYYLYLLRPLDFAPPQVHSENQTHVFEAKIAPGKNIEKRHPSLPQAINLTSDIFRDLPHFLLLTEDSPGQLVAKRPPDPSVVNPPTDYIQPCRGVEERSA